MANIEQNTSVSPNTPFRLASVSKQFFSMGILLLEEQGLLSVNDSVSLYFSEFPIGWSDIKIHHLMSHQSGRPNYTDSAATQDWLNDVNRADVNNAQVLDWVIQQSLDFSPGTQFNYSNTGYVILSMLIERVSQTPIEIFMANSVFGVAGMSNTLIYDESKPDVPGRAISYGSMEDDVINQIVATGDAGIYSTVEDMLLWSSALDDYLFVKKSVFEKAITPNLEHYGYGWIVRNKLILHSGVQGGFHTYIIKKQDAGMTIIVLSNGGPAWVEELAFKIAAFLQ